MTVGLIGLGNAGLALATSLARASTVIGYDRDAARRAVATGAGVIAVDSARAVTERCETVVLSLPDPAVSKAVLRDVGVAALGGRTVIETSTVGPLDIADLQKLLAPANGTLVEAAIVGGVPKLASGAGTFLVGATAADYERVRTILAPAAELVLHLGPVGNAMRAKLVVNAVAHGVLVVLVEAAALAAAQGVPMATFYELMRRDSGLMRPLTHRFAERILNDDFDGGMSTANARKDSTLILDVAKALGVPLFALPAAHGVYEIAMREGLERLDYAAIAKLWERWIDVRFAGDATRSERPPTS